MIRDFRDAPDGARIETDICIVGAGAAGITLARALAGTKRRICLIESGGLEPEEETLALSKGKVVDSSYPPLEITRLRYFGGSTNHWNSYCRPLDAIDFETRSWVPHSGWPITRASLDPFYAEAQEICELGPPVYDDKVARLVPGVLQFDRARMSNVSWTIGPPTRFGERYGDELAAASNVDVILNANVVDLVATGDATSVASLTLKSLDNKSATVHPRLVVLACGGIENARLLLASNGIQKAGLGNGRDLVGRFFADHVGAVSGYVVLGSQAACQLGYSVPAAIEAGGGQLKTRLGPAIPADVQRRERLLNFHAMLECADERSPGYLALREAGKNLGKGEIDGLGDAVLAILDDLGGAMGGVWRHLTDDLVMSIDVYGEMAPNPDSRITLDRERDRLGMPLSRVEWKLSPVDKRSARHIARVLGEELARLDHGRAHLGPWLFEDDTTWRGGHPWQGRHGWDHHMGTTRMSPDPSTGVVDADCRVHGMKNLYIAGSSVFPTYGAAPPTLTIVALALRLADHLRAIEFTIQSSQ